MVELYFNVSNRVLEIPNTPLARPTYVKNQSDNTKDAFEYCARSLKLLTSQNQSAIVAHSQNKVLTRLSAIVKESGIVKKSQLF